MRAVTRVRLWSAISRLDFKELGDVFIQAVIEESDPKKWVD